ncbi:MAG: hypothetical protein K6L74_16090 [Neptuniibacter sp.]
MNVDFFERLYSGFKAEYFVMGELFEAGFEGFKMPGDFGFDLIATNQKKVSLDSNETKPFIAPPYAIQVKRRKVDLAGFSNDEGTGRKVCTVSFWISEHELELIQAEESAYLVCVISISGSTKELAGRNLLIWLNSSHFEQLKQKKYLIEDTQSGSATKKRYKLDIRIKLAIRRNIHNYLDKLCKEEKLSSQVRDELKRKIWDPYVEAENGREYLALLRKNKNDSALFVESMLPAKLTSFEYLGENVSIASLK